MNNIPQPTPPSTFGQAMRFGAAAYCGVAALKCAIGVVAGTTGVAIALAGGYKYEDKTKRKD